MLGGVLTVLRLQDLLPVTFPALLGISYYQLQSISYLTDVYRGKYPSERNPLYLGLYLGFFPHLFLGPIGRYDSFRPQLSQWRWSVGNIYPGLRRILWGGLKKLVVAARLGVVISAAAADTGVYTGGYALGAMVLYTVQLYCDFSGGIDIVLGASRLLGLSLEENFRMPLRAETVQEFWNRWHITLGAWLKEYIYIPLGGNRKGKLRKVCNILLTFLVSGLWHGISYLLWGIGNGILVATGNLLKTRWKVLNRAICFLLISLLWSFFVWEDTLVALQMLGSLFTPWSFSLSQIKALGLTAGDWLVLLAGTPVFLLGDAREHRETGISWSPAAKTALLCAMGLLLLLFGMYGIGFTAESFIYSRF